ncbi:MAG: hypothetical protein ACK6D1_17530 [Planctomycetota bacterium]
MRPVDVAPPPRGRRALLATVAVLVLALVGVGAQRWLVWREAQARRDAALADVEATLAADPVDGEALGRVIAQLRKLPDHATDRALRFAEARIEMARDRAERARELALELAMQPGATADEQSLGAQVLLRLHENGSASGKNPAELLGPAADRAERAHTAKRAPEELLRAWQASERNGEHDRAKAFAATLAAEHADSAAARFVALAVAFDPAAGAAPVQLALADHAAPPAEGRAMLAFAQLQLGDLAAATATCGEALARAPGVAVVRFAAAVTYHACALGFAAGSPDRAAWVARRDTQVDWLLAEPGVDDDRRAKVRALRDVR